MTSSKDQMNTAMGNGKPGAWRPGDSTSDPVDRKYPGDLYRPEVLETIEGKIGELDESLRRLSLDINGARYPLLRLNRFNRTPRRRPP